MSDRSKQSLFNTKTLATLGMLCAIAFVAKLISNVLPMVAGFLSFDLKDVIIVIAGFIFGPLAALFITVIVSLVEMVTISSTGLIGFVMNVIQSTAFACTAAAFYQKNRNMKGAITGLIAGVLSATAIMILWNWLITPLYMGVPREMVVKMLVPTFLPFNLVKGGLNATLAMLLYKPIVTTLRKAKLVPPSSSGSGHVKIGIAIASFVLLVSFVLLALVLAKVI
ncbi:MAG: ECF transporter S component [Firmicutes bacterium]|nr:ECF transporter S component [Bacillota bacterium]